LCVPLMLNACVSASTSAVSDTVRAVVTDRREATLTDAQVSALGVGALELQIDSRKPITMILGEVDPDSFVLSFYSQDRARLDLMNGRLTRSRGFQRDYLENNPIGEDPFFDGLHTLDTLRTYYWRVSLGEGPRELVTRSRFAVEESPPIVLNGARIPVKRAVEYLQVPDLNFETENHYWFDASGVVIKSSQQLAPGYPRLKFLLRSYRARG